MSADIAWVWDHQTPPAAAPTLAVTVHHLELDGSSWRERPRLHALPPTPHRRTVIPVAHVEAQMHQALPLNAAQTQRISSLVKAAAMRSTSGWVQLDFEARPSQRQSYQALLQQLRAELAPELKLSITLLAWQCRSQAWMQSLAADEVVPMFFRMGRDSVVLTELARTRSPLLHPRRLNEATGFAPQHTAPAPWQQAWPKRYWFNLENGRQTQWSSIYVRALWPSPLP